MEIYTGDQVLSKYLTPILDGQKAPNTIRGLMYILKSKDILKKSDYDVLDKHLVAWRLAGYIGWDQIADGSLQGTIDIPLSSVMLVVLPLII
jgi:hypothetical protein